MGLVESVIIQKVDVLQPGLESELDWTVMIHAYCHSTLFNTNGIIFIIQIEYWVQNTSWATICHMGLCLGNHSIIWYKKH